jgi:hypothetical protein
MNTDIVAHSPGVMAAARRRCIVWQPWQFARAIDFTIDSERMFAACGILVLCCKIRNPNSVVDLVRDDSSPHRSQQLDVGISLSCFAEPTLRISS